MTQPYSRKRPLNPLLIHLCAHFLTAERRKRAEQMYIEKHCRLEAVVLQYLGCPLPLNLIKEEEEEEEERIKNRCLSVTLLCNILDAKCW